MKKFPRNEVWDYFVAGMPYVDVWYNILDSPDTWKVLYYMYEIMAWAKERGIWGDADTVSIKRAKEDFCWDADPELS